jgi:EpsI family protein
MEQATHNLARPTGWRSWLGLGLVLTGLVISFTGTFVHMWQRWFPAWRRSGLSLYDRFIEGEGYYTHGPLIVLVSLLIAGLLIRHTKIPVRPAPRRGGAVVALFGLIHLAGCLARVNFVSGLSLVGLLAGLVLLIWGTAALRRLWFPIVLLLFMVPAPEVTIARLNFRLKMFTVDWSVWFANLFIVAERVGNRVFLEGDKSLIIANVCNGLRTLISLLAFGALYAYVCKLRGPWRGAMFLLMLPVAIASNFLRIVSLIFVAEFWTVDLAAGWYHDISGLGIYVIAFALMFLIEKGIFGLYALAGRPMTPRPLVARQLQRTDGDDSPRQLWSALGSRTGLAAGGAMVVLAGASFWVGHVGRAVAQTGVMQHSIPSTFTIDGRAWTGYGYRLDERTELILENPEYILRRYVAVGQPPVDFYLIFGGANRKGVHPPDLCIEGLGDEIYTKQDLVLKDVAGFGDVPVRQIVAQNRAGQKKVFLYTYRGGGSFTRSFWKQQLVVFLDALLNRPAEGALLFVSTPMVPGHLEAIQRCEAMLRQALPHLVDNAPREQRMPER